MWLAVTAMLMGMTSPEKNNKHVKMRLHCAFLTQLTKAGFAMALGWKDTK
jgi:hypothetical protein